MTSIRPQYRIVLQARTSSKRLPAKVLLPIKGIPLVLLCARRLSSQGAQVVVATSTEPGDDALVDTLTEAGVDVVRGPLNDVLDRYMMAISDLQDEDLIVRTTADNPVPDGSFVSDLVEFMVTERLEYATTCSPTSGLPYGLSAEVMTVGVLRKAHLHAVSPIDREHVTPWVMRNCATGCVSAEYWGLADHSNLRCTIDAYDDFERMQLVFTSFSRSVCSAPWLDVVNILAKRHGQHPRIPRRIRDGCAEGVLALGTAQLGMNYGYNNRLGKPNSDLATRIIRSAIEQGVTWLDTAAVYGDSEERIGKALEGSWRSRCRVVSKLAPIYESQSSWDCRCIDAFVDRSVYRSLYRLRCNRLDTLLLHRWQDRTAFDSAVWDRLKALRKLGLIGELGVSLYSISEAINALTDPDTSHIQIPFNVLDDRWLVPEFQTALKERPDVRVHARSVFLQGFLLSEGGRSPLHSESAQKWLTRLDDLVSELGRQSRAALCVAYVRSHCWIDTIILGVESMDQLKANLSLLENPPLTDEEVRFVRNSLQGAPRDLIDPLRWAQ